MREYKENFIIRFLKWIGLIKEYEIPKSVMCLQSKATCNRNCEMCAWSDIYDEV